MLDRSSRSEVDRSRARGIMPVGAGFSATGPGFYLWAEDAAELWGWLEILAPSNRERSCESAAEADESGAPQGVE